MTAKEFLSQYRRLTEQIRQIDMDLAKLTAEIDSMTMNYDGMPKGTKKSDRTGRLAVELASRKEEKTMIREDAWAKREEIQQVIDSVQDPVHSRLLYDRYILCWSWSRISEDLHYDDVYTRTQLHNKALQEVSQCITHPGV